MAEWDELGGNLVFILSPPRAGSTMLQLMLESHSRVAGGPEPHVMVPLRFTGYFAHPEKADYNVLNASLGIREFVERLPGGEESYVEACRAYAGTLYRRARESKSSATYFVDKTPPNVLEWRFVARVFPNAKYIVLLRHPVAVLHSFAGMSFMGDYRLAHAERPILSQYIPAVASFLRDELIDKTVLRYEDLVSNPEQEISRVLQALDLEFEPGVVEYGSEEHDAGGVGDQIQAYRLKRPDVSSINLWQPAVAGNRANRDTAAEVIGSILPEDLATYGYDRQGVLTALSDTGEDRPLRGSRRLRFHHFKRRIYFVLRSLARRTSLRRLLRSIRYYCDVLLRE